MVLGKKTEGCVFVVLPVGEENRGQGFQLSNRQVIINKGIPLFCYIIVFNEAYEYILSEYGLTFIVAIYNMLFLFNLIYVISVYG